MNSNTSENKTFAQKIGKHKKFCIGVIAILTTSAAMAQTVAGLCVIAGYLKSIAAVVALIAVAVIVINSFFTKSEVVADFVTKVLIGCTILAAAGYLISTTGLSPNCTQSFF